jgi:hypothetical protein
LVHRSGDSDWGEHLLYLYHPDTQWHEPFGRLEQSEMPPLADIVLSLSKDLFVIFGSCSGVRADLQETMGREEANTRFYLFIPLHQTVVIPFPFLIVDKMLPLTIYGTVLL